jgi:hypothetical protein
LIDGLAALIPAKRSAEDIFAGRIRVELGGTTYTMPVRSRKANREWLEALDASTGGALDALETLDDTEQVLRLLSGSAERFLDALVSYDANHALPSRDEIDDLATDMQITKAIVEVWLAANPPLVSIALGLAKPEALSPTSTPSPPGPTAGPRARSRKS